MIRRNISLFAKEAVDSVILDLRNEGRNGLADWLTDRKNLHWAYLTAHKAESGVLGKDVFTSIVEAGRFVTHYAGDESFATKTEITLNTVDRTGETERGVPAYPVNTIVQNSDGGKTKYIVSDIRGNGMLTLVPLSGKAVEIKGYSHLIDNPAAEYLPKNAIAVKPAKSQVLRFSGANAAALRRLYENAEVMGRYIVQPALQNGETDPIAAFWAGEELYDSGRPRPKAAPPAYFRQY